MAVAFDAYSQNATEETGNISFTHTPVGTPRGILIFVFWVQNTSEVSSVTYGGDSCTLTPAGRISIGTEPGSVVCYWLGTSIPTGAQTVSITVSGASGKRACCYSVTASADTEIADEASISTTTANPSATLNLGGKTSFCAQAFTTGEDDIATNCTPLTNWTSRMENDSGTRGSGSYSYNTIGSADVTVGYTDANSEETALLAVALTEVDTASGDSLMDWGFAGPDGLIIVRT